MAWINQQKNLISCGQAETPSDAIRGIAQCKPDIVLLDLRLRDGDGFEVLSALTTWKPAPPTIVLTSSSETGVAEKALRAGARAYILKDELGDVLLRAIDVVLKGGTHVSGSIHAGGTHVPASSVPRPGLLRDLGHREHQVLQLLGRGLTVQQIAEELILNPKTVESHLDALRMKLDLSDNLALVRLATVWEYEGRLGYLRSTQRL
jgi:DNA-binding NarL/FixJ family response regulator